MTNSLDREAISKTALEIKSKFEEMVAHFPQEKENLKLLKNLAAASVHFSMFMVDLIEQLDGVEGVDNTTYNTWKKKFLDSCGCPKDE